MIKYAFYNFEFGILKIGFKTTKIFYLKPSKNIDTKNEPSLLTDLVFRQVMEYFDGKRIKFDFNYELYGTDFQKKVWNILLTIPYGETRSYKDIATLIGNPKASRAVGMANNKNPLTIIFPCHRVIGSNGKLVGYFSGLEMKEKMLFIEKSSISFLL